MPQELTVRQYAEAQGMAIQTVYRKLWDHKVQGRQILGRWLITLPQSENNNGEPGSGSPEREG